MGSFQSSFAFCATCAAFAVVLPCCGPRHLSALGNPGDFCTEQSSCTDGSDCRPTHDGYRCVGGPHDTSATPSPAADEEDEEPEPQPQATTAQPSEAQANGEVMAFDESGDERDEESAEESEGGDDEYLPPSRRRRRRGR